MPSQTLELLLIAALAMLLLVACVTDGTKRDIPNWLTGTIAIAAPLLWWATGTTIWPDIAIRLGVALATFGVTALLFYMRAMGGGDVKLLTALALWLPALSFVRVLIIMALAGGALTIGFLLWHRARKIMEKPEVPYGIAIAFGGLWVLYERYINHFA